MNIHILYGELAAFMVRATSDKWLPGQALSVAGAVLDDMCQMTFEAACARLRELGVARFDSETPDTILLIDQNQVAQFVADRSRLGNFPMPSIDEVLADWFWSVSFFGFASERRTPFEPHPNVTDVTTALVALGYAKTFGTAVLWTDKIGPAMQRAGVWNEDGVSNVEIEELEVDKEMRKAVASLPADVRFMALRGDNNGVLKALCARWSDDRWGPECSGEASWWMLPARAPLANRLIELVQGSDHNFTSLKI
jgi:hypothetical protein